MHSFITHIIDFLFPPTTEELRLRSISPFDFSNQVKKSLPTEFPFINSLFSYKDPLVRELIWQIKYKKNKHALECAGRALYDEIIKKSGTILLIPIPVSKKRRRERGYNQCELIIDEIIKLDKDNRVEKDYGILIRNKNIDKQTFKNRDERIENSKNIFKVIDISKINKGVVIIDDVSTTGSTLSEARESLISAGYLHVEALTVAH